MKKEKNSKFHVQKVPAIHHSLVIAIGKVLLSVLLINEHELYRRNSKMKTSTIIFRKRIIFLPVKGQFSLANDAKLSIGKST